MCQVHNLLDKLIRILLILLSHIIKLPRIAPDMRRFQARKFFVPAPSSSWEMDTGLVGVRHDARGFWLSQHEMSMRRKAEIIGKLGLGFLQIVFNGLR